MKKKGGRAKRKAAEAAPTNMERRCAEREKNTRGKRFDAPACPVERDSGLLGLIARKGAVIGVADGCTPVSCAT